MVGVRCFIRVFVVVHHTLAALVRVTKRTHRLTSRVDLRLRHLGHFAACGVRQPWPFLAGVGRLQAAGDIIGAPWLGLLRKSLWPAAWKSGIQKDGTFTEWFARRVTLQRRFGRAV